MCARPIRLGSRGSALALCQAAIVQKQLQSLNPQLEVVIEKITAQADANPELPLSAMSGEGVFVKELEAALLKGQIDFAVHSLKDMPLAIPKALCIAAVLKREEPRDALVARQKTTVDQLPGKARVGTSSLRRKAQLLHHRGDLEILDIRGNVDTRLRKLDEGRYDAIVIAGCGLMRLGMGSRIAELLDMVWMLSEPGQGALAIEARSDDQAIRQLIEPLNDLKTRLCIDAERAFLSALGGGCSVPIAAYASDKGKQLFLQGAVIASDGHEQIRGAIEGALADAQALGKQLADQLTAQGARRLLV